MVLAHRGGGLQPMLGLAEADQGVGPRSGGPPHHYPRSLLIYNGSRYRRASCQPLDIASFLCSFLQALSLLRLRRLLSRKLFSLFLLTRARSVTMLSSRPAD